MDLFRNIPAIFIIFLIATVAYPQEEHAYHSASKITELPLRLWGTITGANISTYAIIENTKTRRQKLYRPGDAVLNATVVAVQRHKIVLSVDGHLEILEIETGRPDVNLNDHRGVTALIDASFAGKREIVELLILKGADLNARDRQGDTALMNAALKGHLEIVELLIAGGADVNIRDNAGNTALIDSAKYPRDSACEIIERLVDNNADINAMNTFGLTALILAAQGGHVENVECLIAEGADVNAKSKSGETALKFAELSGRKDIAELLKENGAKE